MIFIEFSYNNQAMFNAVKENFSLTNWRGERAVELHLDPTANPNVLATEMLAHAFFALQENPDKCLFYFNNRLFNTKYWVHVIDGNYYGFFLDKNDHELSGIYCQSDDFAVINKFVNSMCYAKEPA